MAAVLAGRVGRRAGGRRGRAVGPDRCGCCSARSRCAARGASTTTSSTATSTRQVARTARAPARRAARCRCSAAWVWLVALCLIGLVVLLQLHLLRRDRRAGQPRAGRRLSVHEAHHLVAAGVARHRLQLGGAGRLERGRGRADACRGCCSMPGRSLWVIGYDTIYALQDREDDAMVGVRSSALRDGAACRGRAWRCSMPARWCCGPPRSGRCGPTARARALLPVAVHLGWQVATLAPDDGDNALARFRSNRTAGLLMFAGLLRRSGRRASVRAAAPLSRGHADPPNRRATARSDIVERAQAGGRRRRRRDLRRRRRDRSVGPAGRAGGCRAVGKPGARPARVRAARGRRACRPPTCPTPRWMRWSSARWRWRGEAPEDPWAGLAPAERLMKGTPPELDLRRRRRRRARRRSRSARWRPRMRRAPSRA